MKRLLTYLKPHVFAMIVSLILTLFIIVLELYRPIIIGDAIDDYINSYYKPYAEVSVEDDTTVSFRGKLYSKSFDEEKAHDFIQLFLCKDKYYLFHLDSLTKCEILSKYNEEVAVVSEDGSYVQVELNGDTHKGELLSTEELEIIRTRDFEGVNKASVDYLLILFLSVICNMLSIYVLQRMGQDIIYEIRNQIFNHIHTLSVKFFNNVPVGVLVTRVTNDTESVNELFTQVLVKFFKNIIMIVGYAVVMVRINPRMTGYAFIMMPFVFVLTFYFRYLSRKAYRMVRSAITEINIFLSENLSGMRLIQIFTREDQKQKEFEEKNMKYYKASYRELMTFAIFRPSIYGLSVIALVLIMGFGGKFTLEGTLTIGTLYIFINYIKHFFEPIQELAEQFGTLQSSIAASEKIFSILDEKPDIVSPKSPAPVESLKGEIEFKHVWFAYENEEYVLKDINFKIKPGEKVAFVGATGAGKTSILNLMGRYYDVQKGQILIDGIDIKDMDLDTLRGDIGQVLQDVFIFTGNIRENITLRNENISDADMIEAAKYVNADHFIDKLPRKYDEPVSERGATFSAGQRQLLSFARTLAYDPKILVLDEATANIDTETESLITEALEKLMEGRTTIMVAHRLSTIQHADRIMVMDHGEIKECGSHQELLAQNGIYKKLYDLQLATQE